MAFSRIKMVFKKQISSNKDLLSNTCGSRTTRTSSQCKSGNATWQASHVVANIRQCCGPKKSLFGKKPDVAIHQRGVVKEEQPYDVATFINDDEDGRMAACSMAMVTYY